MIRRTIRIKADSVKREEVLDIIRSIIEPIQAKGRCISCRVFQDASDPGQIMYVEEWESTEALDVHLESAEYRRVLTAVEFSETQPVVTCEEVIRPVESGDVL